MNISEKVVVIGDYRFKFKTNYQTTKFINTYLLHRQEFNKKFSDRYGVNVKFSWLSDLILYRKICKTYFNVEYKGNMLDEKYFYYEGLYNEGMILDE